MIQVLAVVSEKGLTGRDGSNPGVLGQSDCELVELGWGGASGQKCCWLDNYIGPLERRTGSFFTPAPAWEEGQQVGRHRCWPASHTGFPFREDTKMSAEALGGVFMVDDDPNMPGAPHGQVPALQLGGPPPSAASTQWRG